MSPVAGPIFAAAALLGAAGATKVVAPASTRVALRQAGLANRGWMARALGVVEVTIAALVLLVGGRLPAALLAATYFGFGGFSALLAERTRGTASCGCFGSASAPVGRLHVTLNAIIGCVVAVGIASPTDGVVGAASGSPLGGVALVGLSALVAWLLYVAFTLLPMLAAEANRPEGATA